MVTTEDISSVSCVRGEVSLEKESCWGLLNPGCDSPCTGLVLLPEDPFPCVESRKTCPRVGVGWEFVVEIGTLLD